MTSDADAQPRPEIVSTTTTLGFAPGVAEKIGSYVYLLIDPHTGAVFYIGKGAGDRCFQHIVEARTVQADSVGDYAKLGRIREIESCGSEVEIKILRHGLCDSEALLVESAAIDLVSLLQPKDLTTRRRGDDALAFGLMTVDDINIAYGAVPVDIDPGHQVVLIRINRLFKPGMSDPELYEATRKWWPVGGERRKPDSPRAPKWAMTVFGGVVRAVYRIDGWEQPSREAISDDRRLGNRWAFHGVRDRSMDAIYLHRDVWAYLRNPVTRRPSQFPLRYIYCDALNNDVREHEAD
jgi:uncharacterized protein